MKRILPLFALFCLTGKLLSAQDLIGKVPFNAGMVIKYSGENFSKHVPLKKLDNYAFIKDNVFKMLHIDGKTSLQNIGIDFEKDIYQYLSNEDTCTNFVTLLPLKNEAQFLKLVKANYGSLKKIEQKNGYNFVAVSDGSYIGWNKTSAVIVNATYQNRRSYWDNYYSNDTTVAAAVVDSAVSITTAPPVSADTAVVASDSASMDIEVVPMDKQDEEKEEMERRVRDSINNLKWELWQQQQDMIAKKQQEAASVNVMNGFYSQNLRSIKNSVGYARTIDPNAHASIWINTESILEQYWGYFYRGLYGYPGNPRRYFDTDRNSTDTSGDFSSAVNLYFDKDKLRMENKTFSSNSTLDALAKSTMNSRQSSSLVNYVNPDNIGYFSLSINSEAMANYYYAYMKKYLANMYNMQEYSDLVNIYIDLLEIVIDEKGIADLLPGNYIFVMHDMKPRIVNYTDYEYDDEFNRKEVKKTKKELSPSFTFAFETRREDFMKKLANLPVRYAEKGGFNYKEKEGGYYELAFKEGDMPFSSMYFMVKDGKAIITTSKEVIDMTISNRGFTTDEATKNSILNNNYSLNISSKRLIEKISTQVSAHVNKKISEYLLKNLGDLKMESGLKNGMIQGTTTLSITGNNSNSLEFLFNMMDAINSIMEHDRQERDKKLY